MSKEIKINAQIGESLGKNRIYLEQPKEKNVNIVIVGEQHDSARANKMMFAAQGVREIRGMMLNYKNSFPGIAPDYGVLIIFKDAYSLNQLAAVKKATEAYGALYVEISTLQNMFYRINDVQSYLNIMGTIAIKIASISIYCHGLIGNISLGYGGSSSEKLSLNSQNISNLDSAIYTSNAVFRSYACRTGLDENASKSDVIWTTPNRENSLAQKIADHLGIDVFAYQRRSNYGDTWGSINHRQTLVSDNDSGTGRISNMKADIYDFLHSDPADQKTWEAYHHTIIEVDGADWHEKGAYLGVKCGDTPKGVSVLFEKYSTRKLMFRQG